MAIFDGEAEIFAIALKSAANNLQSFKFQLGSKMLTATNKDLWENVHYANEGFQLLGKCVEYEIIGLDLRIPFANRFHKNERGQWKLMSFTNNGGQVFGINLDTAPRSGNEVILQERVKVAERKGPDKNNKIRKAIIDRSTKERTEFSNEFYIDDFSNTAVFGKFDFSGRGKFVVTTGENFLRDFIIFSLIKGHFLGNKDYDLGIS